MQKFIATAAHLTDTAARYEKEAKRLRRLGREAEAQATERAAASERQRASEAQS